MPCKHICILLIPTTDATLIPKIFSSWVTRPEAGSPLHSCCISAITDCRSQKEQFCSQYVKGIALYFQTVLKKFIFIALGWFDVFVSELEGSLRVRLFTIESWNVESNEPRTPIHRTRTAARDGTTPIRLTDFRREFRVSAAYLDTIRRLWISSRRDSCSYRKDRSNKDITCISRGVSRYGSCLSSISLCKVSRSYRQYWLVVPFCYSYDITVASTGSNTRRIVATISKNFSSALISPNNNNIPNLHGCRSN